MSRDSPTPVRETYPALAADFCATSPIAWRTRSVTSSGKPEGHFPMVEVANPSVGGDVQGPPTIFVYRPWSPADLKDVAASLPNPELEGGEEFNRVFLQMLEQYRPNIVEIEMVMMKALQLRWGRVKGDWPVQNGPYNWGAGSQYRITIMALCGRIGAFFPRRMNWEKISDCKQKPGERVTDYRNRLEKEFEIHSGMGRKPEGANDSPWEQQCKTRLVAGLLPDLQKHVKEHCVALDEGRMEIVWPYIKHAEKVCEGQEDKKKDEKGKREAKLQMAQLGFYSDYDQMARGRGRARGRTQSRGRGRGSANRYSYDKGCHRCGSTEHWVRDCPEKNTREDGQMNRDNLNSGGFTVNNPRAHRTENYQGEGY
ncbi:uncharacterized protein LOC114840501 [Esox lucius]|uniref:uncharacterized protein LOC114840501 n=1 Tax=Esox lucius TaxID=8010 RepID=UPI0014772FB2|nr:uncharacterized protein LOC114840501 [Esox lucius]